MEYIKVKVKENDVKIYNALLGNTIAEYSEFRALWCHRQEKIAENNNSNLAEGGVAYEEGTEVARRYVLFETEQLDFVFANVTQSYTFRGKNLHHSGSFIINDLSFSCFPPYHYLWTIKPRPSGVLVLG